MTRSVKVPSARFELAPSAPEADDLSPELRGRGPGRINRQGTATLATNDVAAARDRPPRVVGQLRAWGLQLDAGVGGRASLQVLRTVAEQRSRIVGVVAQARRHTQATAPDTRLHIVT